MEFAIRQQQNEKKNLRSFYQTWNTISAEKNKLLDDFKFSFNWLKWPILECAKATKQ